MPRFWLLILLFPMHTALAQTPEVIYTNARIWTGAPAQPWAEALAIGDGVLLDVGPAARVEVLRQAGTRVVDLSGQFVVPGFIDNHTHFLSGGFQLASVDLRDADTPEEFARRLGAFAASSPEDRWITGGDWDHERWGGLKGFVDGSLGSTTAWFYEPYTDAPETTGLIITDTTALRQQILDADARGLHLAVHAIGDRANDWLLDVFAEAAAQNGARDRRFRIEHAQHLAPGTVARFTRQGVIPSMQPYHAIDDGRWAEKRSGPERIQTTYALRAYTAANAYAGYQEERLGTLEAGKWADLVVLSGNLFEIDPVAIQAVRVLRTVVGGQERYSADF